MEASIDLIRHLLLGNQLIPWELHPLVLYSMQYSRKVNLKSIQDCRIIDRGDIAKHAFLHPYTIAANTCNRILINVVIREFLELPTDYKQAATKCASGRSRHGVLLFGPRRGLM